MQRIAALILVLAGASIAQAGWLHGLGRNLGIGWSDGYHAFDQCSPRRGACFAIPPGGYVPQDPILVPFEEPLPAPIPAPRQPQPRTAPDPSARRPSQNAVPHPAIPLLR